MREILLDDFVGHIEEHYGVQFAETARGIIRCRRNGCRGERLQMIARAAAEQIDTTAATIMEGYGRACAQSRCGREIEEEGADALASLVRHLREITGDGASVAQIQFDDNRIELVIRYRDGAGCGDVVAGLISGWGAAYVSNARFDRQELSPVRGCHVRFHLVGELLRAVDVTSVQ